MLIAVRLGLAANCADYFTLDPLRARRPLVSLRFSTFAAEDADHAEIAEKRTRKWGEPVVAVTHAEIKEAQSEVHPSESMPELPKTEYWPTQPRDSRGIESLFKP